MCIRDSIQTGYRDYFNRGTDEALEPYLRAKSELDQHIASFQGAANKIGLPSEISNRMIVEGQNLVCLLYTSMRGVGPYQVEWKP